MSGSGRLRLAVFGSPAFSVPTLERVAARHDLRLVVAQDDKPAGRRMRSTPPAAAVWARERGVRLRQPERLKGNEAFLTALRELDLDVAVTAAYGKILPSALLGVPRHGVLNVHASLLPAYRGAAPVQWALIDGCHETGVSIMQTETGLDTGPVRHVRRIPIAPDDDAVTLMAKLAHLGADALEEALDLLALGALPSVPQDDEAASYAPRLTRDDGRVRWHEAGARIQGRHRGVAIWPGSWTTVDGDVLKVHDMAIATGSEDDARGLPSGHGAGREPGTITAIDADGVRVAIPDGTIVVREVQAPGRARTPAAAWARGARIEPGVTLV
jgi:methionyl-tRNA formyltransferase